MPETPSKSATMPQDLRRQLIIATMLVVRFFMGVFWETDQINNNSPLALIPTTPATLQNCTEEESLWQKPDILSSVRYNNIVKAEKVLRFLIAKLDEVGAPITIMYGTLLREYRNGTGPCLQPDYNDKDFDIAVFPEHFHYITTLEKEIYEKFGWVFWIKELRRRRLFTQITPPETERGTGEEYMSIDVYGFHCSSSNDLIYFPWDGVAIERNAILPVVKHKLIPLQTNESDAEEVNTNTSKTIYKPPGFFVPFNTPCLLHNIYGSDFMTPKSGKSSQAKWGTDHGRPAYYNPVCNYTLTPLEEYELNRQLSFCSGDIPKQTRSKPHLK